MHPLSRWISDTKTTRAAVVAKLREQGVVTRERTLVSDKWLRDILGGWRKPTFDPADPLSPAQALSNLTEGKVTVVELRAYERTAPARKGKKRRGAKAPVRRRRAPAPQPVEQAA
jgi:hypothetical protein